MAEEFLRLTTLLQRTATPADVILAIRSDPEHPLRPAFQDLTINQDWSTRLAWLVNRLRLEQGLAISMPADDQELVDELRGRQHRYSALSAAVTDLTRVCAEHWPAITEADGETLARRLISQLELARRRAGCCV